MSIIFITRSETYIRPPGRPELHSPSARSRILAEVDTNRHTAFKAVAGQHDCSTTTIRRIAATGGLHRQVMCRAPIFSEPTRLKRLQWAQDNEQRDWRQVLFTDAVPLTIGKDTRRKFVTRRSGEAHLPGFTLPITPHGKHIMLWSVIGYDYKGPLIRFDLKASTTDLRHELQRTFRESVAKGINGPKYAEWILRGPLRDAVVALQMCGISPVLVEDNAPCHNIEYCDRTRRDSGFNRMLHSPSSPDPNPIENVWSRLNAGIANLLIRAGSHDALWEQAKMVWKTISIETINDHIDSMPRRLRAVKMTEGRQAKYKAGRGGCSEGLAQR